MRRGTYFYGSRGYFYGNRGYFYGSRRYFYGTRKAPSCQPDELLVKPGWCGCAFKTKEALIYSIENKSVLL